LFLNPFIEKTFMLTYNTDKVDEIVLALLFLTSSRDAYATRAWKGMDRQALDRLFRKGYISDPNEKTPTLILSDEAAALSQELFCKYFDGKL
jgi:hypothetical protein